METGGWPSVTTHQHHVEGSNTQQSTRPALSRWPSRTLPSEAIDVLASSCTASIKGSHLCFDLLDVLPEKVVLGKHPRSLLLHLNKFFFQIFHLLIGSLSSFCTGLLQT